MIRVKICCLLSFLITIALLTLDCSKNSTEPENGDSNFPAELVGDWRATQFIMTNKANPTEQADLIQFGISYSLAIQSNGNYTSTLAIPGEGSMIESGSSSVQGDQITVDPSNDDSYTKTYAISGNTLTVIDDDSEFDFDDDGIEESANLTIVLQKN
jgi:hypothetical protein